MNKTLLYGVICVVLIAVALSIHLYIQNGLRSPIAELCEELKKECVEEETPTNPDLSGLCKEGKLFCGFETTMLAPSSVSPKPAILQEEESVALKEDVSEFCKEVRANCSGTWSSAMDAFCKESCSFCGDCAM